MLQRHIFVFAYAILIASCGGEDGTGPGGGSGRVGPPAQVASASGNAQTAVVGTKLGSPLTVKVTDAAGKPVSGTSVAWAVTTGGGTLSASSSTTDKQGQAQTEWTLGTTSGSNTATATVGSLPPASFTARATAASAAKIERVKGDAQAGTAGGALADSLSVRVTDAFGNGVSGASVSWAVTAGGGAISPASSATDTAGVAKTQWIIGKSAGANVATATTAGVSAVTFNATGKAGAVAKVEKAGGDDQSSVVGTAVATAPSVKVVDRHGNPVSGASVSWSVAEGEGTLAAGTSTTNAEGTASVAWTLGRKPGRNKLTAMITGLSPVEFVATANAGPPAKLTKVEGDAQSSSVGSTLRTALALRVTDALDNPLSGVAVTFTPVANAGTLAPGSAITDAAGLAKTVWTLGTTAGTHSVTASAGTLPAVTFTATATAGGVARMEKVGGDTQSGTVAQARPTPLAVRVTDAAGNPLPNIPINWSAPGTITSTTTTGPDGISRNSWTLGTQAGTQMATARWVDPATGQTGVSASFSATGEAASTVLLSVSSNWSLRPGQRAQIRASAEDAYRNRIPSSRITFEASPGLNLANGEVSADAEVMGVVRVTADAKRDSVHVHVVKDAFSGYKWVADYKCKSTVNGVVTTWTATSDSVAYNQTLSQPVGQEWYTTAAMWITAKSGDLVRSERPFFLQRPNYLAIKAGNNVYPLSRTGDPPVYTGQGFCESMSAMLVSEGPGTLRAVP